MTDSCTYLGDSPHACGSETVPGRSYCEQHLWRIYKQGTAVHRRKDARRAEAVWSIENALNEAVQELEAEGFDCWADSERLEA